MGYESISHWDSSRNLVLVLVSSCLFLSPSRFLLLSLLRTSNRSLQEKNRSKNRSQNCSIRVRIVVASRFIYELLLLVGSTRHTHKARGDFISRRSSRTTTMGGLALLLLVCMAVAVHYVIAALSIMEVSLLLWLFFANLFLLFVVSLSVAVCRCFV
jgi:hypothetical protein